MQNKAPKQGGGGRRSKGGAKGGARATAARIVQQVSQGRSLSDLLKQRLDKLPPSERPLVQELCFGTLRWYCRLHGLAGQLLQKPFKPKDGDIHALILIGLYQLLYMRIPPHAAVAETAGVARSLGKSWAVGLVNGVLRRFLREQEQMLLSVDQDLDARFSCPRWLLESLQAAWPDHWQSILEAMNQRPPMSLRVNQRRLTRQAYLARLAEHEVTAEAIADTLSGVVLAQPRDVAKLPGFPQGEVSVQDGGAQLAAELLDLKPGQRVLDACAAPGGKSCHILEIEPDLASLTAVDIDDARLVRVEENLQRLGLEAELVVGDAADPQGGWAERRYDRILLDVPCSATGVIRRHPDIKLLRRPEDIEELAKLQARILDAIWPLLKPGGMLLYATCSLLPQENELQLEDFVVRRRDAAERLISGEWGHRRSLGRQTLPGEQTMDGFYYACLEKGGSS